MIGSLLLWVWVWVLGTFLAVLGIVLSIPFNPWTDPQRKVIGYLSQAWGRGVMWVLPGLTIEARGFEHLHHGPVMLCPNHVSVADIIMLLAALPQFKFVAKTPIFLLPPIGWHLLLAGHVRAGTGAEGDGLRVLARCLEWFERGSHILWFPEGHRSEDGKVMRFHNGPFLAAKKGGVPIVPVAISGTREVIGKRSLRYYFSSRIQITLLPPFMVEGEPKASAARARALVAAQLEQQRSSAEFGRERSGAAFPFSPEGARLSS